ncbi:DUF4340 domain-containing protein, partial [Candidatus Sumerlaeota bacterium]|nr:DUF4340 domain-containing protein [Candidatus Sumerlaeota bacterium]
MAKNNQLIMGTLALVVLAVAALVYWLQGDGSGEEFRPGKLFEDFDVEAVAEVQIGDEDEQITLRKAGDSWGLVSRGGYAVGGDRLRRLVYSIATLDAADRMTDNPEKYEALGVGDEPDNGYVRLLDAEGGLMAGLYVGKERQGRPAAPGGFAPPDGQYVRIEGDPRVYKIKDVLTAVDSSPTIWLEREILDVNVDHLREVRVDNRGTTDSFTIGRESLAPSKLEREPPEGFEEKSFVAGTVSRPLSSFSLNDVLPADDIRATAIDFTTVYSAIQKNGLVYVVGLGKFVDDHYARVSARYDQAMDLSLSDERTSDTVTAKELELAEVTVEKINERHSAWVYQIPSYKYEDMTKILSDMIEEIEIEEVGPPADAAPPGAVEAEIINLEALLAIEEPTVAPDPADDPLAGDPPASDPPSDDPLSGDPPADDPLAGDPPASDPPSDDPPADDPPASDPPASDPPA